jgi:hypothetical protein
MTNKNESISNFFASISEIANTNPTVSRELKVANFCSDFANIIINLRKEKRMSVEELADKAVCSVEEIETIESPGPNNTANIADMIGVCLAFNLNLEVNLSESNQKVITQRKDVQPFVAGFSSNES